MLSYRNTAERNTIISRLL